MTSNGNRQLKEDEERHCVILHTANDGYWLADPEGRLLEVNAAYCRLSGYTAPELLGMRILDIEVAGADDAVAHLQEAIAAGRDRFESRHRRKNGTIVDVEVSAQFRPIDGGRYVAAIRDISVRKAAETHLAQMEGRYRGLLEAAPDAMVVVDQHGEIVLLNVQAEKQFGYARDELVGQAVTAIIPEGFAERLVADDLRSTADALAQQIGTGIELVARRKDGTAFPIEIMLSPLENADGILVTAAIRDISVRKAAETHLAQMVVELQRSNEELGQFAYIASHDLQEPLRMVASYTQLLSRRYKGRLDSDADEFIAFATDGASRMQRLIEDLLAYSRVGTKGTELVEVSSEDALQLAMINLSAAVEDSGALVTHDPLPLVLADEMQLSQLFQNLVGNAIKYRSADVPRVHICAVRDGQRTYRFAVRDNGLGIDPQYFEKIFGVFQRLHKRDEFPGTGIGLAICKKIVERHGGTISVESQPGLGSTFSFSLPGTGARP
jgi:PAS domain S-box-containing protein